MSEVVICYSVEEDYLDQLRQRVEAITDGAADVGLSTFAYIRDVQGWDVSEVDYREAFAEVFRQIEKAQAVILDLTTFAGARRTGLGVEAGYAKALGKAIIGIWLPDDRPHKILSVADINAAYDGSTADLRAVVSSVLSRAVDR